ncbi:MAG: efflux RND transporter permease subunit, partial [Bradyrhizobium sp.]
MIARLIAWSARNLLLVLFGAGFATAAGIYALAHLPLDAIPDLSDTQVIVYTEYPGQAPQVIEDQVTYPLTTAMLTVPRSKVVRGFSFFGVSFVYVIFEDGTDIYWARSRVLEFLNSAASRLPAGVTPTMGPDATGVGWVYQYAVMSKELNLSDTRAIQDWNLKFALAKAEGVAEVASVGGFVRQYNVVLDPQRMRDLGITMQKMRDAIRASNADVGGRTVELSEFEHVIRGRGYIKGINDLGNIVLKTSGGTPVLLKDVARVELGPDERRGITELNGEGEVASGIVLQRFGVNALDVIQNVKKRISEIGSSLPKSVEIVSVYDRSNLINAAIDTLKRTLFEESVIVALVCIVFLLHVRSALVAILMLPVGVLMAFGAMKLLGLGSNIMSLGGIAIAIGAMVDAAIVMIENAHKHLERAEPGRSRVDVLIEAASQVGPALFFSLLIITVSFMPIFTLESQEGRLFSPLAFTKTFAMAAAALLSVTLVPALMVIFVRGKIIPEHKNPINRFLIWIYRPVIKAVMRAKVLVILMAVAILAVTIWPARQLGTEFMPNLNEGTLLYMPTTLPGISVTKAGELLQTQDRIIRTFPEVESVYGKAGRAMTATDPAPSEMFETVINLKPKAEWRPGMTVESLTAEMDRALQFPGVSNAWTQPIKARIDM